MQENPSVVAHRVSSSLYLVDVLQRALWSNVGHEEMQSVMLIMQLTFVRTALGYNHNCSLVHLAQEKKKREIDAV